MTLNVNKCMFHQSVLPFWGVIVSEAGIHPYPAKVKALMYATRPQTRQELMLFLRKIRSNKDSIPFIAQKSVHLCAPTKKGESFKWDKECQREFDELRNAFSEDVLMTLFDPDKKTYCETFCVS